ncbi:MAG: YceD family protein [Anaerolineae bacterium]
MMLFNVAQLIKEGIGSTRHYEVNGVLNDLDEYNPGPTAVEGQVTMMLTALGILASVKGKFEAKRACRRCLELVTDTFQVEFEEEFLPSIDIETGVKLPLDDTADPVLVINEHHTLDLTEVLRQYALVELADGTLCRPGCSGLCPGCGENLNTGKCICDHTIVDPRLAVLAKLLDQESE